MTLQSQRGSNIMAEGIAQARKDRAANVLPVMYRRDNDGIVFALFPTMPGTNDPWTCTCYQHVGQHSSADLRGCIAASRPATPDDYKDLHQELTGIYDDATLRIVKRTSPQMNTARFAELDK